MVDKAITTLLEEVREKKNNKPKKTKQKKYSAFHELNVHHFPWVR